MSKVSSIKSVIRKVLECFKDVDVQLNNIEVTPNNLLQNKTAIITGVTSGIGKATAKKFINSGATVIGIGRNEAVLRQLSKDWGNKFIPHVCDISDLQNLEKNFCSICNKVNHRPISILINCAGAKNGNDERFFQYSFDEFDSVINTNLKAVFFWSQFISKYMIDNKIKGHIVNVASIKGFIGEASPYSVSKWGCVGFTKGLARLLAPYGIIVNGIAPGGTATNMAHYQEGDSLTHMITPNMRLALPDEMANLILFLASDLGQNIVGEVIISDGGQVL